MENKKFIRFAFVKKLWPCMLASNFRAICLFQILKNRKKKRFCCFSLQKRQTVIIFFTNFPRSLNSRNLPQSDKNCWKYNILKFGSTNQVLTQNLKQSINSCKDSSKSKNLLKYKFYSKCSKNANFCSTEIKKSW